MTQAMITNGHPTKASLKPKTEDIFRSLWASLFFSGKVSNKAVMVCSASRREGATTIATSLAVVGSVPAGNARVALVDMNLRNPYVHRELKLDAGPGVAEIITEGVEPEAAARRVSSGLDVYTAGDVKGKTLDILRSDGLKRFLDMLCEGYDHVLVDVAPANAFPDAQVLAGILPEILLVCHSEQVPREVVAQAKKRLESGGGKLVGLVMNMRTYPIPKFLYKLV